LPGPEVRPGDGVEAVAGHHGVETGWNLEY